jgi:serine/threonine protein kinase
MFAQMYEAIAACHDASMFHCDLKPENFIVTNEWALNQDGIHECKVIIKLSDFGLSTCDAISSDMDCGSAPYMSYSMLSTLFLFP